MIRCRLPSQGTKLTAKHADIRTGRQTSKEAAHLSNKIYTSSATIIPKHDVVPKIQSQPKLLLSVSLFLCVRPMIRRQLDHFTNNNNNNINPNHHGSQINDGGAIGGHLFAHTHARSQSRAFFLSAPFWVWIDLIHGRGKGKNTYYYTWSGKRKK